MASNEVTQIKVGKHRMGIIGLKQTLANMAKGRSYKSNEEIEAELLKRVSKRNYIPETIKEEYGRALLREFKKFTGQPVEETDSDLLEIKVLGPGCARCNQLEQDLMAVMVELDIAADIEHVTDISEIGSYGVMGTPALIINSKVKSVGTVPSRAKLKAWLMETVEKHS